MPETENQILVLPAELVQKIDRNRGDLSRAAFLSFLIDARLKGEPPEGSFATKEELEELGRSTKELLRSFLDFMVVYGMELGYGADGGRFEALREKLQETEPKNERGTGKALKH